MFILTVDLWAAPTYYCTYEECCPMSPYCSHRPQLRHCLLSHPISKMLGSYVLYFIHQLMHLHNHPAGNSNLSIIQNQLVNIEWSSHWIFRIHKSVRCCTMYYNWYNDFANSPLLKWQSKSFRLPSCRWEPSANLCSYHTHSKSWWRLSCSRTCNEQNGNPLTVNVNQTRPSSIKKEC